MLTEENLYQKAKRELDKDIFNKLEDINPFPTNKGFTEWIIRNYLQDKTILDKANEISDALEKFNKLRLTNNLKEKDITRYTVDQILSLNGKQIVSKTEEKKSAKNDADKLYEDDTWLLIKPKTYASACLYGKNTKWCVSSRDKGQKFKEYSSTGSLLFLINKKNPKEKYALNKEMNVFSSSADIELSSKKIQALLEKLPEKLAKMLGDNGIDFYERNAKNYIDEDIPFPDDLKKQIIAMDDYKKNKLLKILITYPPTQERINKINIITKNLNKVSEQVKFLIVTGQYNPYKKALRLKGLL